MEQAEVINRSTVISRQMMNVYRSVARVLVRDPESIDDDPLILLSEDQITIGSTERSDVPSTILGHGESIRNWRLTAAVSAFAKIVAFERRPTEYSPASSLSIG